MEEALNLSSDRLLDYDDDDDDDDDDTLFREHLDRCYMMRTGHGNYFALRH